MDSTVETNEPVATDAPETPKIKAAFVIAIGDDGTVFLERNTQATTIPVEREASMIEIRRYLSEILMDLQAQAAAEYTLTALSQARAPQAPDQA
jgi:hypothetical protein